ncbi:hypothetical protein Bbelb_038510 [Branchiostoma belcheri]|nr:hypothetical protein Bbelb_038510 [Branchiostoma belcheri]
MACEAERVEIVFSGAIAAGFCQAESVRGHKRSRSDSRGVFATSSCGRLSRTKRAPRLYHIGPLQAPGEPAGYTVAERITPACLFASHLNQLKANLCSTPPRDAAAPVLGAPQPFRPTRQAERPGTLLPSSREQTTSHRSCVRTILRRACDLLTTFSLQPSRTYSNVIQQELNRPDRTPPVIPGRRWALPSAHENVVMIGCAAETTRYTTRQTPYLHHPFCPQCSFRQTLTKHTYYRRHE